MEDLKFGELHIPVKLDFREMERQRKAELKRAVERAGRSMTDGLGRVGPKAAKEFLKGMEKTFRGKVAESREALFRGLINEKEFQRQGQRAARAFNRAVLERIEKLAKAGKLGRDEFIKLSESLKKVGDEASAADKRGLNPLLKRLKSLAVAAVAFIAGRRLVRFLGDATRNGVQLAQSFLKLSASAKLFGVEQQQLNELSKIGASRFKLTIREANELAVVTAKLAAKAGDVTKAQELMAAALDLGAAQGLSATEVAVALEQTLRGLDEGTDKLLQKNPISIFKDYAASIGKSVQSLTDMEQKQALMNAVLEGGGRVVGAYNDFLEDNVGKLSTWGRQVTNAKERIGTGLIPILAELTEFMAGPLQSATDLFVQFLERIDRFTDTPIQNLAKTLERVGASSEAIAELGLLENLESIRKDQVRVREQLPGTERVPSRNLGGLDPAGVRKNGFFDVSEVPTEQLKAKIAEVVEGINAAAAAAISFKEKGLEGGVQAQDALAKRLELYLEDLQAVVDLREEANSLQEREVLTEKSLADLRAGVTREKDDDDKDEDPSGLSQEEINQLEASLTRLNTNLQNRLADLTATAVDNTRLALEAFEAEMRDKYAKLGRDVPAEVEEGLARLRQDLERLGQFETVSRQFEEIQDVGEASEETATQLQALLTEVRAYKEGVEDGSSAQERWIGLERQVQRELKQTTKELEDRTKARERERKEEEREQKRREQERARAIRDTARDLQDNVRAALRLAESFDLIESNAARALEAISEIATTVHTLSQTRGLEGALSFTTALPGLLGAGAAVVGAVSGLFGRNDREEAERKRHVEAMHDLRRALEELTDAVSSDMTPAERETILSTIEGARGGRLIDEARVRTGPIRGLTEEEVEQLRNLEEWAGTSFMRGNEIVNQEAFLRAYWAFKERELGGFDKDVDGRLDALNFTIQALGEAAGSGEEQFGRFLETLRKLPKTAAFADQLQSLWQKYGPEGVRNFLREAAEDFAANGVDGVTDIFGQNLTADEIQRLIQEGLRFAGNAGAPGSSSDFTQTRSITEVTGNRMAGTLTTIEDHARAIREHLVSKIPPPGSVYIPPPFYETGRPVQSNQVHVSFESMITGGVHVTATGGQIDKAAIFEVMEEGAALTARRISEELAKERRRELSRRGRH